MVRSLFAGMRVEKLRTRRELSQATAHGRRTDHSSRRRVVEERAGQRITFSRCNPDDPLDIEAACRARIAEMGAAVVNGRPIALHALLYVSPDWIREVGDLHDPRNHRNRLLVNEAVAFCEATFGEGSVIAGRMDLDEQGGGGVDVFIVPIERLAINKYSWRISVTVEQPLLRLQSRYGTETSFAALQSAWAEYAQKHIDPRLQRGISRVKTGRDHVYADAYREEKERAKSDNDAARSQLQQEVEEERIRLIAEARAAAAAEADRLLEAAKAQAEQEIAQGRSRLRVDIEDAVARIRKERKALNSDRQALSSEMERVAGERTAIEDTIKRRVDVSLTALSTGLAAYEQGRFEVVPDATRPRGLGLVGPQDMTRCEREALLAELAPGWAAGLGSALSLVHTAREAAVRSNGHDVTWISDPPRF